MANILQYLVPLILLGYLGYQARKSFAGVVALFLFPAFGANAYLRVSDLGLPIKEIDVFFLSILIMWIIVRKLRPVRSINLRISPGFILAAFVVLMFFVHLFIGIFVGLPASIIPSFFRMEAYFGLGFFLWADVFSRFHKDEIWNLFYILSIPTVFLSILYMLSAVGFSVYPYKSYLIEYVDRQEIIRDFVTSPKFLFLALTVILLRRKMNAKWLIALSILVVALFFLYTRVYTIQFVCIFFLSFIWHLFRNRQKWMLAVQYSFFLFVAVFVTVAFDLGNSTQFAYFFARFQEFFNYGINTRNLAFRMDLVSQAYTTLVSNGLILWGNGMKDYANINLGILNTIMDSGLAFVLFNFGLIATVFYCLQMLVAGIDSFRLMRNRNFDRSRLGAYLFITMITYIIAILNLSYVYDGVLGVIPLSLIYVESLRKTNNNLSKSLTL